MNEDNYYQATILDENENPSESNNPTLRDKAKGAGMMAGGAALGVAGIPMLILPGPGAAAIAGGIAIASKGHRTFTGREATPLEETIDAAAETIGEKTKDQAKKLGEKVVAEAPELASEAIKQVPEVAKSITEKAPIVAKTVSVKAPEYAKIVADKAPVYTKAVVDKAPEYAAKATQAAPELIKSATQFAKEKGPEFGRKTMESITIASSMGKETGKHFFEALRNSKK